MVLPPRRRIRGERGPVVTVVGIVRGGTIFGRVYYAVAKGGRPETSPRPLWRGYPDWWPRGKGQDDVSGRPFAATAESTSPKIVPTLSATLAILDLDKTEQLYIITDPRKTADGVSLSGGGGLFLGWKLLILGAGDLLYVGRERLYGAYSAE